MRRASVITFVAGLAVLGLGVAGVLEGGVLLGLLVALAGVFCFGLSFIRRPAARPDAPPPLPLVSRIVEVFTGSTRVFQELHAHPRWLVALLIIAGSGFAYNVAFTVRVTPEVITAAGMNKAVEAGFISPERAAQVMQVQIASARSVVGRVSDGVGQFIAALLVMLVLGGLYYLGVRFLGGRINFWAALGVAIYASLPPVVINNLLSILLLYVKSPEEIDPIRDQQGLLRDHLGVLFSPSSQPLLYTAASFIGVLTLYRMWLTARGLRHAGERVSASAAWTVSVGLWGTGLLLALAWASVFPNMA